MAAFPTLLEWVPALRKYGAWPDTIAGLTAAAVVIPKALGYATIAGLPIQVGLYTCFVPMIVYAVLGTSRCLSFSTTTTLAILTGAELSIAAPGGTAAELLSATAMLGLLVGAALVLAWALRLGFIANFISEPVLVGFKAGIGIVIIVDQMPKMLGVHFAKGTFIENLGSIAQHLPDVSIPTLVLSALAIGGLAVLERFLPRWPAPLIVVGAAIACVALLGGDRHGIDLVGELPRGLPALSIPNWPLATVLWPGALGIALMSFTETAAVARAFARESEPPPQPNIELFASGVANAAGAFLGAMPAGGGASQTAVNRLTGARTQLAELVTASMALLAMVLLSPLIALMPHAVLASVVIFYSLGLIKPRDFRTILGIRRTEFLWAVAALLGVMLLGTLKGILVAIIISVVALAYQTADPPVYALARKRGTNVFRRCSPERPDDETFPGLLLLHVTGRLFFLNVARVADKIRPLVTAAAPKVVALDLSGVFDLEYSALKMLTEAEKRLRETGVQLWLVGLSPEVLAIVRRSSLGETLGNERLLVNLETAVHAFNHPAR